MECHRVYCLIFMSMLSLGLNATNVGGHITQDTTWRPENNPYNVTAFLYVDAGVTLTIMPGVQVRVADATDDNVGYYFQWHGGQEPVAKMIVVSGRILAIGTESQPITFDNTSGDPYRRWGGIIMLQNAPESVFRYCQFQHQNECEYTIGYWNIGVLGFYNGVINLRNCTFHDFTEALRTNNLTDDMVVYGCNFSADHLMQYSTDPKGIDIETDPMSSRKIPTY